MGNNVRELADVVSPVIDIGDQYVVNVIDTIFGGCNPANNFVAAAGNLAGGIPSGETWKVHAITGSYVTGGAVTIADIAPAIQINGVAFLLSNPIAVPINRITWSISNLPPMWLPSGTLFGLYSQGVVGAPVGTVQVLASRFKS